MYSPDNSDDNNDTMPTLVSIERERRREWETERKSEFPIYSCLYAAVCYEKPTRHPSKASAKKYLKVREPLTAARSSRRWLSKRRRVSTQYTHTHIHTHSQRERYAYYIDMYIFV